MRAIFVAAAAACVFVANALGQTPQTPLAKETPTPGKTTQSSPPAASGPSNPAVKSSDRNTAAAPVAGANSFTEGEAKARIEARGFSNVTQLRKDEQGIWRGRARRNGAPVDVALDFQGNVFPAQP